MVEFGPVTEEAILTVAEGMREADRVEVWASNHFTPEEAIRQSVKLSHVSAAVYNAYGEAIVILGLVKLSELTGTGVPWLLGTENALNYKRHFITEVPRVIEDMLNDCPTLVNYVHVKNVVSVRWLKRLGFKFENAEPYGVDKELFHRFSMER